MGQIFDHELVKELSNDAYQYLSHVEFNITDIQLSESVELDEFEYYIHNTGFYLNYFLKLCRQLEMGVEFLTNYKYNNKSNFHRIDHLIYNIENYIIRYQSSLDRLLQLINCVFHLTIDEKNVSYSQVMSNIKVTRTTVPKVFTPIKSQIDKVSKSRNTIIHRHSYLEKDLRKLELLYPQELLIVDKNINRIRLSFSQYIF